MGDRALTVEHKHGRDITYDIAFLKQVPLFSDLSDEQAERLLQIVSERTFERGKEIIKEKEVGDEMYILLDGTVEVSKTLTLKVSRYGFEEHEKTFIRLEGRDHACFGEMAVLDRVPRSATVVAVTPCSVLVIRREDFDRLCADDPPAGYLIVRRIAQMTAAHLRAANQDVLKLTTALSLALAR